jgi:CspA family cold shock protein
LKRGTVTEFDDPVGIGTVTAEGEGGQSYFFHCTQIADGTRTIATGTQVAFKVVAGRMGRWEAVAITPYPGLLAHPTAPAPPR